VLNTDVSGLIYWRKNAALSRLKNPEILADHVVLCCRREFRKKTVRPQFRQEGATTSGFEIVK